MYSRYAIYVIKDNKVDVEKLGDKDATYDQFLVDLKQKDGDRADCRFAGNETLITYTMFIFQKYFQKFTITSTSSSRKEPLLSTNRKCSFSAIVLMRHLSRRKCFTAQALILLKGLLIPRR